MLILMNSTVMVLMKEIGLLVSHAHTARTLTSKQEKLVIAEIQDSCLFTCGSFLFGPMSPYYNTICVKESLTCSDPIELAYFSSKLVHFPPVCFWCGLHEDTLVRDGDDYAELERNYQTVHAICMICQSEGKKPFTRHPLNAPKRK